MRKLLSLAACLLSLNAMADFPVGSKYDTGSLTNVPATILGGTTSNINAIIFTYGKEVALFPFYDSTNSASAGNMVLTVQSAADRTLTNWNTVNTILCTNALNGTTDVIGKHIISAAEAGPVGAIRISTIQSTDGATNNDTINRINWSLRFPD